MERGGQERVGEYLSSRHNLLLGLHNRHLTRQHKLSLLRKSSMAKSKQCYYINHEHIAILKKCRPLSKREVDKIKAAGCAKVDNIRDEEIALLYQELPEGTMANIL